MPAAAAFLGIGAAPIFPALIASTPTRVGAAHTANAVGLQIACAAPGQAGLPALVRLVAPRGGLEWVPRAAFGFAAALFVVSALASSCGEPPESRRSAH